MATAQDTRERQGSGSTMTAPPGDSASDQSEVGRPNTPGDPDSTFPQAGATDRSVPGTANYRPGQGDASGSNGGDTAPGSNGGDTAAGSNGAGAAGANSGAASDTGSQSAGGASSDTSGSGDGSADETGDGGTTSGGGTAANDGGSADGSGDDSRGLLGGDGGLGGLIPDAVADTQSLGSDVLADAQSGGSDLIADVVNGTGQLVGNAVDNLSLGDGPLGGLPGGSLVGGVTDGLGNGIDAGNVLGDGPALTAGVLGDGNGAIAQPVSDLTGGLSDGILSPNGDGPIVDLGVVGSGSPAVTGLLGEAGNDTLGDLGLGRIAEVNGAGDGNGDQDLSATAGNEPGESGPLIGAQAFGSGNPPSNNLIDIGAGPNGENSGVIANVLGGSSDGSNPQADANLIDAGPNGQTAANADVLTSPDQFQFPVLDGAGTDALAGVLGGQDGTGQSIVPDAGVPAVDVGTNPIVDVDLAGNADAGQTQNPLQAALNGQLLGAA